MPTLRPKRTPKEGTNHSAPNPTLKKDKPENLHENRKINTNLSNNNPQKQGIINHFKK